MLSPSEEKLIKDTWSLISSDLKGNGSQVFVRFFTDYPKYQQSFKSFAKVPFEDLPTNKRFLAHAFTVISAVDGMVENIDDPEMLDEMLLKTGINHGKRKINGEAFDEFQISFMAFLKTALKDKWTSKAEEAWGTVAGLIMSKIKEGMEQADD